MMISARTAPKTGGKDDVQTLLVYGDEKDRIAEEIERIGKEKGLNSYLVDRISVKRSSAIIILGVEGTKSYGLDCGACGYTTCKEFDVATRRQIDLVGPNCLFKSLDIGIALSSATSTAMNHNLDNRIMYTIGVAAMRLGMMKRSSIVIGIPISVTGKSVFFDRL